MKIRSTSGMLAALLEMVSRAVSGRSAVLMASATAFAAVKLVGAAYLVYLGVRTLLDRADHSDGSKYASGTAEPGRRHGAAFRQGVVVEALNPKTALFLLAFLPQFVDPSGPVAFQILVLGCLSVFLNAAVDLAVACFAGPLGVRLRESARLRRQQRRLTGCLLVGLGAYVAVSGDKG